MRETLMEFELANIRDIPAHNQFIVRNSGDKSWWGNWNQDDQPRETAHIFSGQEDIDKIYNEYVKDGIVGTIEVLKPEAEAAQPTEVVLTSGSALFGILKANQDSYSDGFTTKDEVHKAMRQAFDVWAAQSKEYLEVSEFPPVNSFAMLGLMLNGQAKVITRSELQQLQILCATCHGRLKAICNVAPSPTAAKFASGVHKSTMEEF
jgi:hypothetical protein